MRFWLPVAAGALVLLAYALFYALGAAESQGSASLGLANAAGLAAVLVGLLAAGFIFRRGGPPPETSEPGNP